MRVEARVKGLFIYETEIERRRFVDHRWKVWCEWNNIIICIFLLNIIFVYVTSIRTS
ncbi:hypothetical protein Hanom_Chr11g01041881 [Helianthus anomalus]